MSAVKRSALAAAVLTLGAAPGYAQSGRLAQADFDVQALSRVAFHADGETPLFLAGALRADDGAAPAEAAVDFLSDNARAFGFERAPGLEVQRVERDALGKTHVYVRQTVGGVPVFGAQSALHLDATGAYAWGGDLHPEAEGLDVRASLSGPAAIDAARASLNPTTVYRANQAADLLGGEAVSWAPQSELVVYPQEDGTYRLAYHVQLFVEAPVPANWNVFVDARTGEAFHRFNGIHTMDVAHEHAETVAPMTPFATTLGDAVSVMMDGDTSGTGNSIFGGSYALPTYLSQGAYYLYNTTRGPSYIRTMSANGGNSLPGSYVTDSDNSFSASAAVDAHYGAISTFDYFKNTHGRSSYNGNNATITSTVNYDDVPGGVGYNNAFWNGQQMVYGDGDGSQFIPLVSLDIAAHELTHAVTSTSAGLIYQNESGALNEAVSDIMAVMVDRDDYLIGEQSYTPGTSGDALRYLNNPPAGNQPDNYADRYTGSGDYGGVHINSGIANKQAYLMIAGGTFRGVTVGAVGRSVTEKVWYRALTTYFTQSTNFAGARQGTLQAATDLYGAGSAQVISVTNAWAAVGVGSAATGGGGTGGGSGTPEWRYETVTIQSPHNYPNNYNNTQTYSKPGAERVAMYFQQFDLENNYDYVYIKDASNATRATYTGSRSAFWAVVDGDAIKANLVSDYSVTRYGYRVTRVAYFSDQQLLVADPNPVLGFVPEAPGSDAVVSLGKTGDVTELALGAAPNPVRGTARISASLPEAGALRVTVLDLLGREVAVLADGQHEAGVHELALDAAAMPAGVYVVVLESGAQRLTERVTVLR